MLVWPYRNTTHELSKIYFVTGLVQWKEAYASDNLQYRLNCHNGLLCPWELWLPANLYIALIPSQNTIQVRIELTEMTFIVEMNYLEINFAESKLRVEIENMGKKQNEQNQVWLRFSMPELYHVLPSCALLDTVKTQWGECAPSFSLLLQIWGSTIILSWCSFLLNCKHRQSAGAFSRHCRDSRCLSEAQWHSWTCLNTQPCGFLCVQHLNIQFDGFVGRVLICINACNCINAEAADCFFILN